MGTLSVDKLMKTSQGAAEFTLPAADGTANQVMQTDGAGQLSFATVSSDPTMGGDLSGPASNAQIVADAVGSSEIAANAVTASEIAASTITPAQMANSVFTANRNILNNGAMQIAQRATSLASLSATVNTYHTLDRWMIGVASAGTWTMSQSATAADGFGSSLLWECTTASTSLAAGGYIKWGQFIEGYNVQQLKKGTAAAETITLSFWVKAIVKNSGGTAVTPATFIAEAQDEDNTRAVSASFTITAQDTWEYKTITFPADTTGALGNDANRSFAIRIAMAAGSTYSSGTLQTTWGALSNADRYVGCTNLAAHTDNKLWITGMQLEVGSNATPYERRSYGQELYDAKRYFRHVNKNFYCYAISGTVMDCFPFWEQEMRANPSCTLNTTTPNFYEINVATRVGSGSAISTGTFKQREAFVRIDGMSSLSTNTFRYLQVSENMYSFSADL